MPDMLTNAAAEELAMECLRAERPGRLINRTTLVVKVGIDSLGLVEWISAFENELERRHGLSRSIDFNPIDQACGSPGYELGGGRFEDAYANVTVGQVIDQLVSQIGAPATS